MTPRKTPKPVTEFDMMLMREGWPGRVSSLEAELAASRQTQAKLLGWLRQFMPKFTGASSMVASRAAEIMSSSKPLARWI